MRVFHCDHCGQLVFFENTLCVKCGNVLAYMPDIELVGSLEVAAENGGDKVWQSPLPQAQGRRYKLCRNYTQEKVCNWALPEDDPDALCLSCRLTTSVPDMQPAGRKDAWYRLELAKRRLIYSLLSLKLPLVSKAQNPVGGLSFEIVVDPDSPDAPPALTGHSGGVIRINLAEADDVERERRRHQLHEPYRTLLGHFRHESGHYYWDLLIRDNPEKLGSFRQLFGDEQQDYAAALQANYTSGPPPDWQQRFISAYASCHAWEDWAESWAHYLHMVDALETAAVCGVSLRPKRKDEPALHAAKDAVRKEVSFEDVINAWFPLTYVLNNFNRGLGLGDAYPFVLPTPAIEKLRFIHDIIRSNPTAPQNNVGAAPALSAGNR